MDRKSTYERRSPTIGGQCSKLYKNSKFLLLVPKLFQVCVGLIWVLTIPL